MLKNRPNRSRERSVRRAALGLALGLVGLFVPVAAFADSGPTNIGATVTPAIKNVVAEPGQVDIAFTETIENDTAQALTVTPEAADFGTTGVNGAVQLKHADPEHGLAGAAQFSPATITLAKGQSGQVAITLHDVAGMSPGGHFAAIRWQLSGPAAAGQQGVGIKSELMSFVFLTTAGKATYGVTLKASLPRLALWQLPAETDLLFTNTANTQTAPRGVVNIAGPRHGQVVNGIINTGSALVLPGSTRLFQTPLPHVRTAWWPGRYSVDVYYRATETASYAHLQASFWYIGWPCWLAAAVVVVGVTVFAQVIRKRRHKHRQPPAKGSKTEQPARAVEKRHHIPIKHL